MQHVFKGIILSCLLLTACVHTPNSTPGPVPDIILPRPAPINMEQPDIMVINRENLADFTALVDSGLIFISMTVDEFNKLVENNQQIMVYISNQNAIIDVYEDRIKDRNTK